MAIKVALHGKKKNKTEGTPLRETHFFDVEKCKRYPFKENCGYKEGQASKSYTVIFEEHEKYQETTEFKELAKKRYMIEAKNSELKNSHGFDKCHSHGLLGMQIQSAMTIINRYSFGAKNK